MADIAQEMAALTNYYLIKTAQDKALPQLFDGCSNDIERVENLRELTSMDNPLMAIGMWQTDRDASKPPLPKGWF